MIWSVRLGEIQTAFLMPITGLDLFFVFFLLAQGLGTFTFSYQAAV